MEFFDKKEDVIDLQLTQFGRHLLSKGKFKPVFYSFFDDNILYDSAKAGITEAQNDAEERIREAQNIQPLVCFSSLEKEFNTSYDMVLSGEATPDSVVQQKTAEKNYILPQPLGTGDINAEFVPSWSLRYLNGNISGSSYSSHFEIQEKDGGKFTTKIPQIQTDVEIKVKQLTGEDPDVFDELLDAPALTDVIVVSDEEEYFVLLKVIENNGTFQKKNFDIEMFEIVEQKEGDTTIEVLRPLHFPKPFTPEDDLDPVENVTPMDNQDYVAHYFDLRTDDEISNELLCQYDPENTKLGVYADERATICQDILNERKKSIFNIYEEGTQDNPGDIC